MLAQHVSKSISHFIPWHDELKSESLCGRRSQKSIAEIVQKAVKIQIKIESRKVLI